MQLSVNKTYVEKGQDGRHVLLKKGNSVLLDDGDGILCVDNGIQLPSLSVE